MLNDVFHSCNETDLARGGPVHSPRTISPHTDIAPRGWLARRWEDREDVLASRTAAVGLRKGAERKRRQEGKRWDSRVSVCASERASEHAIEREDEVSSESVSPSE